MTRLARWSRGGGRFLKDLVLGDSPVFLPVTLAVLGLAYALRHDKVAAAVVLPASIATLIGVSALWAARASRRPVDGADAQASGHAAVDENPGRLTPRALPPSAP